LTYVALAGVVDQTSTTLKNTSTKIEQEVSSVVKEIEDNETSKKVGNELKQSDESLGQRGYPDPPLIS